MAYSRIESVKQMESFHSMKRIMETEINAKNIQHVEDCDGIGFDYNYNGMECSIRFKVQK